MIGRLFIPESAEARKQYFGSVISEFAGGRLRTFLYQALDEVMAPEFWTAPASSSGKHHPAQAHGDGGLVWHSLTVMHWVEQLFVLYGVTDQDKKKALRIAALFHDGCKGVTSDGTWKGTPRDHGAVAAERLYTMVQREREELHPNDVVLLRVAADLMEKHYVQWSMPPVHFTSAPHLLALLATADFVSSRPVFSQWTPTPR